MLDTRGRIVYVGKAKNLRARLRSYRGPCFSGFPSKTRRLLLNVHEIHWLETSDETAALLTENECLRTLKPRFNVQGTSTGSYSYFSLMESAEGLDITLSIGRRPEASRVFGAFRGIAGARRAHAALLRWVWVFAYENCLWPVPLLKPTAPLRHSFSWRSKGAFCEEAMMGYLNAYLSGLTPLPELVLPEEEPSLFLQSLWRDDQIRLARFYHSCESLAAIRDRFELGERALSIEEVDDLRILLAANGFSADGS